MSRKNGIRKLKNLARLFLMPALMLLAAYILLVGAGNVSDRQQAENLKQMQDTIIKLLEQWQKRKQHDQGR